MVSDINNDIKFFSFIVVISWELLYSFRRQRVFKEMVRVVAYCQVISSDFSINIKRDFVGNLFSGQIQENYLVALLRSILE
jgi:hypothetical protein